MQFQGGHMTVGLRLGGHLLVLIPAGDGLRHKLVDEHRHKHVRVGQLHGSCQELSDPRRPVHVDWHVCRLVAHLTRRTDGAEHACTPRLTVAAEPSGCKHLMGCGDPTGKMA